MGGNLITKQQDYRVVRNIIIYYPGTRALATGGGLVTASGQEAGGLLFILSRLLMVLLVRLLLGDRSKDAGLGLNIKKS